jgi:hypothetical protein
MKQMSVPRKGGHTEQARATKIFPEEREFLEETLPFFFPSLFSFVSRSQKNTTISLVVDVRLVLTTR